MHRRRIYLLFTTILLIVALMPIKAESADKIVKIGYIPNHGVMNEPYVRGHEGYGYEYFDEISRYTNHEYEFVLLPSWGEAFEYLDSGKIDLLGPTSKTPEREEKYLFTDFPFGKQELFLSALESSEIYYNDFEKFNGLSVGLVEDNAFKPMLEEFIENNNLSMEIIEVEDTSNSDGLINGDYDLRLDSSIYVTDNTKVVTKLGVDDFYFVGRKNEQALINEIDAAIAQIYENDMLFADQLFIEYFGDYSYAKTALTTEELDILKRKPIYNVGYNISQYPISYLDGNDRPNGIGIDVMNQLAFEAGIELNYIPIDSRFDEYIDYDFNICTTKNCLIKGDNLSEPYMFQPIVVLVNNDLELDEIKDVVAVDYGSISLESYNEYFNGVNIIKTSSIRNASNLFENNTVDAMITSLNVADAMMNQNSYKRYRIEQLDITLPVNIAYSNTLPNAVVDIFDKLINNLDDEYIQTVTIENMSELEKEHNIYELIFNYRYIITIILVTITAIFLLLIILFTKRRKDALDRQLNFDNLTGLMTKRKFTAELKKILHNAERGEYQITVLDIDNFKYINNNFGYDEGNKVLVSLGKHLKKCMPHNTLIARETNDTFIILTKYHNNWEASCGKRSCTQCMSQRIAKDIGRAYQMNISKGVYVINDTNLSIEYMIDCAHAAKQQGKNTYGYTQYYFSEEMAEAQKRKDLIVSHMERALVNKEFYILLQPKYHLKTEQIVGAEALIRWQTRDGYTIFPNEFIPLFENNGFIKNIDTFIFEEVCKLISSTSYELPVISVNLSAISLLEESTITTYESLLKQYKVDPHKIEVEITESAFTDQYTQINEHVKQLKALGLTISIDDFGTGDSSLNRLKDMDVDILKLDRGFISENILLEKGLVIMESVIKMAKRLELVTVAEGIETSDQLKILNDIGCDIGQGYHFSKPISVREFKHLVLVSPINYDTKFDRSHKFSEHLVAFEKLPAGIMLCKNDGHSTIIKANDSAYKLMGYTKEEMETIHNNRFSNILVDKLEHILDKLQPYRNNTSDILDYEFRIRKKNGEIIWIHDITKFDHENNVFYITIMDVTTKAKLMERDELTGLLNYYGFENAYYFASKRKNSKCALVLISLNNFHKLCHLYGKSAGNDILAKASKILAEYNTPNFSIARINGMEFAIIAEGDKEVLDLERKLKELRKALTLSYNEIAISPSIGVVQCNLANYTYKQCLDECKEVLKQAEISEEKFKIKDC